MAATEEERLRFGKALRELRLKRGLTAKQLAAGLKDPVSHQNVTGWERGEYPPRRRAVVGELEELLGASPGELSALLGYATSTSGRDALDARFTEFERRLARLEEQVGRLVRRRRGAAE